MSSKLRTTVPFVWVLLTAVILAVTKTSPCLTTQLSLTDLPKVLLDVNPEVRSDILENPVERSTDIILSCDFGRMMSELSSDQKDVIKNLYKFVRKIVQESSHIEFLNESLKHKFISKRFIIQNRLPGNQNPNRRKLLQKGVLNLRKTQTKYEKNFNMETNMPTVI
jgi:hypothetical protein